jgi:hypothetical protein
MDSSYSLFWGRFHLGRSERPPQGLVYVVCLLLFILSLSLSLSSVLDAFAISSERLWNSLCRSPVHMELESHWADLYEIRYLRILRIVVEALHFLFRSSMFNNDFTSGPMRVFCTYFSKCFPQRKILRTNIAHKMKYTIYVEYNIYVNIIFREIIKLNWR